jgi:hypothetical protein
MTGNAMAGCRAPSAGSTGALAAPADRPIAGAASQAPAMAAPRRNRLTKTLGSGLIARTAFPGPIAPLTFLHIIPIEAPCYAVRLGFANCFGVTMGISKASVYPSDSYSVLAGNGNAGLKDATPATPYRVAPTGGAGGCRVYFDHAGADVGTVGANGTQRSFTLAADSMNGENKPKGFTIRWSDFAPCTSIPRADGGTQHLLFVYVTVSTSSMVQGATGFFAETNADPVAHRGRQFWAGRASNTNADYADNPAGTTFRSWAIAPLFAIQYLTPSAGIQGVLNGDSLTGAPTNDRFSTPLHRAAWDLSTPDLPIEMASMAWGSTGHAGYEVMLRDNMAALRGSFVSYQPISRNDAFIAAGLQLLLAKALANVDAFRASYGSAAIWNIAGCIPSADGNAAQIHAFTDMRSRLQALARSSGVSLIDAPSVIGQADFPWLYRPGMSDDESHPNFTAVETVVPMAKAALRQLIGL